MTSSALSYQRSAKVFFSKLPDGQCAILDTDRSLYFGLNPVAARIWALLEAPSTIDALVKQLCSEFAVSEAQCRADVEKCIDQMQEKALVLRVA